VIKIKKKQHLWLGWLSCLSLAILPIIGRPVSAAERVYVTYLLFQSSIPVSALETYAKEGRLTNDLAVYAKYLKPSQLEQLRAALQERIDLDPITISQFLYTPIGERLLQRVSEVIRPESEQSGYYALRSALILAAADPGGLTALSLLRNFPDAGIRVDLSQGVEIFDKIQELVKQTNAAVVAVRQQFQAEARAEPKVNASGIQMLEKPGPFAWEKITLQLNDASAVRLALTGAARTFPADIYLPKLPQLQPRPVIVVSHGLGSNRMSFAYLAEHLASFGFVVAVPEHPGSSASQLQALLTGEANDVSKPTEFVDRPLDVKFLLDELGRQNARATTSRSPAGPSFRGRMNLQQVGVIGQSFGAYTALALAGAKLNFVQLQQDCGARLNDTLNISLLLQCQVASLPQRNYDLSDSRIKAAIAVNPIDSSVFGQQGLRQIKIPVMLVAGSADTVAPSLPEQIQPFTWLTTVQKYLVLIEGATHFSTIGETAPSTQAIAMPPGLSGPTTDLARRYLSALGVAFFQIYTADQASYAYFLTPTSVGALSREPLKLSITQKFTSKELEAALNSQESKSMPGSSKQSLRTLLEKP
jgi:predicted dienelactone hydrolase